MKRVEHSMFPILDEQMAHKVPYPTQQTRADIARRLGLNFSEDMQDWEFAIATSETVLPAIRLYQEAESDEERWSFMQLILAGLEESVQDGNSVAKGKVVWSEVVELLLSDIHIHRETIKYWACPGKTLKDAPFFIAEQMREVWTKAE